jgi:transposase
MTIMAGPERRRRWSEDERLRILTEAFAPGACVAEIARRHDVSRALIYLWRREAMAAAAGPAIVPAIVSDAPAVAADAGAAILVELARGGRVSIAASAPAALVAAALKALR